MEKELRKVILDTNFLIYCSKQKIDYVSEIERIMAEGYKIIVPDLVVSELKELSENSKKYSDKEAAKLALKLLDLNKIEVIELKGKYADEAIRKISKGNIVATVDRGLKNSVFRAIVIKDKKNLAFG
jgi:rRNA-processing protein FCF1